MKENDRPESMDDVYTKENLEFICQYKLRSAVIRVLRERFDVTAMLVVSQKKDEKVIPEKNR